MQIVADAVMLIGIATIITAIVQSKNSAKAIEALGKAYSGAIRASLGK